MNSFCSGRLNRALGRALAGDTDQNTDRLVSILYEVHIDTNVSAAPYSNIGEHSQYPDEEFLFAIGAIFRVLSAEEVVDELGRVWLITIRLVDDHQEQELNDLFEYYKAQVGETSSLLTLAAILFEMDNITAAERYYKLLRDELPGDHEDQPIILNDLGETALSAKRYFEALSLFEQALNSFAAEKILRPHFIITTHNNIATVYYYLDDFDKAEVQCRNVLSMI